MLVDDSGVIRKLIRQILEFQGYVVLDAPSPEEAIRICENQEGEIHLLLTDVIMPGMSGLDLSKRVQPLRPAMKVLYMSGSAEDAIDQDGVLRAGIHFIQKPFSPASLDGKIQEVLNIDG